MSVLIEAISVVVRRDRIEALYPGGWQAFVADCPNRTLCADEKLARVGFMGSADGDRFVRKLENMGFVYQLDGHAVDLAVVDQLARLITPCDWLEADKVTVDGNRITVARSLESRDLVLATPEGWEYEMSLSSNYVRAPTEEFDKGLQFVRHEDGLDVYLSKLTDGELYIGRTGPPGQVVLGGDERSQLYNPLYTRAIELAKPLLIVYGREPADCEEQERRRILRKALGLLQQAHEEAGHDWPGWWFTGKIYEALDEHGAALKSYRRALEFDPRQVDSLREATLSALELDEFEEAIKLAERAVATDVADAGLLANLALAKLLAGRVEEAGAEATRALEMDPDDSTTQALLGAIESVRSGTAARPATLAQLESLADDVA